MAFVLSPSRREVLTSACELVREVLGDILLRVLLIRW